jgi:hypothetical protein
MFLTSCQRTVGIQELIGRWELDKESMNLFKKPFSDLKPRIELKQDGTFTMVDLPQSSFYIHGKWQEFIMRGRGKWQLSSDEKHQVVWLYFAQLDNFEEKTPNGTWAYSMTIDIYRTAFDFYLYDFDGDPDLGRIMKFRKK